MDRLTGVALAAGLLGLTSCATPWTTLDPRPARLTVLEAGREVMIRCRATTRTATEVQCWPEAGALDVVWVFPWSAVRRWEP